MSGADDYEHALGGLRGHIVYGEQTAGDTPVAWVQVKVALPYLRNAERVLVAERARAEAADARSANLLMCGEAAERAATEAHAQHAALAAAVRAEREARRVARLAQSERDALEDDAWPDGDDDERAALAAAGERLDTAEADHDAKRDHLTALLAGAPCGYVEARVVRAYLAAVEAFDGGALGAPCRASIRVDDTRAALVAALERCP